MRNIKYFLQFILVIIFFCIFKILGIKLASNLSGKIFQIIGPLFRSKKLIYSNIKKAFPNISQNELKEIYISMWNNYGRVFAEYMFIKKFRHDQLNDNIIVNGGEILENIKLNKQRVVFISGHFSNFELMAMQIEKMGIKVAAIYRPLNNFFLNKIMEKIRRDHICKFQIKKGIGGTKELVKLINDGFSTALMIDQRVSEGIDSNFAQLVKKYKIPVVPIFIERFDDIKFKMTVNKPINFEENKSVEEITNELNKLLENMILKKPSYWIWSHNRWK